MSLLKKTACFLLTLLPLTCLVNAEDPQNLKNKMVNELDVIKNAFDARYAPAEWKKVYADWDLDSQIALAKAKIYSQDPITIQEFKNILCDFFKSTQDHHVGVHFYSTESAFLPFRVRGVNERYFITWVETDRAPTQLKVGDEVLAFNEELVSEAITQVKRTAHMGVSPSDQSLAELVLTARIGGLGHNVPKEASVTISVLHKDSSSPISYELPWDYSPEEISNGPYQTMNALAAPSYSIESNNLFESSFFAKQMSASFYDTMQKAFGKKYLGANLSDEAGAQLLGAKKSGLPLLGEVIWKSKSDNEFYAYLCKNSDQQLIGYIRIPHYMGTAEISQKFASLIRKFESQSDLLVIDQLNNPGGNMFYMYGLASMLSARPMQVPTQRITITQEDVFFALEALNQLEVENLDNVPETINPDETLFGYPISVKFVKSMISYFHFIINEWNEGRYFTNPTYAYGIDNIVVNPLATYTKPILVLVNELDFSCGDFLPAILQDNKRATIMGARTAGAGGFVLPFSHPNRFGISSYTLTGSIAERLDKKPIENLGVTPDISYEVTEQDLQNGFVDYKNAIQGTVRSMLKKEKPNIPVKPKPPERKPLKTI